MNNTIMHTVMLPSEQNRLDIGQRWLVQIHPLDLEQNRFELGTGPITIGRSPECNIVLDDDSVSRQHAKISVGSLGFEIHDNGSTNGVLVNSELVEHQVLQTGDRIQLGQRIFRFLADSDMENQYHETVYSMMTRDGLTEVFNKRYLLECLEREFSRFKNHQRPLAVIILDIDHFKKINDTYGHLIGDEVLKEVAYRLRELTQGDEMLARFGGEEFAIIDGEADPESARKLAERCREAIASKPFETSDGPIEVTISLGVATPVSGSTTSAEQLIALADERLYAAKRGGRNRVMA